MANIGDYYIKDYSADVLREEENAVEKVLTEIGLHIEGQAKKALSQPPKRIDTGLLRNSIAYALSGKVPSLGAYGDTGKQARTYKADKPDAQGNINKGKYTAAMPKDEHKAVYIGTNVEYAVYVHEGTRKMAPNAFLKNAIEANMDQIKAKIKEALRG